MDGSAQAAPRGGLSAAGYSLTQRRIFILPTAQGLAFFAALGVMLIGAINYNNSLGYMLVFLLGSMALVSTLHAYRNLAGLKARPGRSAAAFAGEPVRLGLCLDNPRPLARRALRLAFRYDAGGKRPARQGVPLAAPAGQGRCTDFAVPSHRRGRLELLRPRLETRFPLGLFRAWAPLPLSLGGVVYPAPAGERPLPEPLQGAAAEGRSSDEGQEDFSGHRDFHPGDPPRRVNWKAAARDPRLQVKVFQGGGAGDRLLTWDEAGPGDTEQRLSQLCRWLLEAEQAGGRYGLRLPGTDIAPDRGEAHLEACLTALALHGLDQGGRQ